MCTEPNDKMPPKLLTGKIRSVATGEWVEGYPICARFHNGNNFYWMVLAGCTIEELSAGGLVYLGEAIKDAGAPSGILTAKAKSFVTGEWVQGYPFYAKAETEESSYWLIRLGSTVEEILTTGLVKITPETIIYENANNDE